jgi:hypothetical protein
MGFVTNFQMLMRVLKKRKRPMEKVRLMRNNRALTFGVNAFEMGLMASSRVENRLKALAGVKTSALIGCPF